MSDSGYALIKSPYPNEAPAILEWSDFLLLWLDAHNQNPKRWPYLSYTNSLGQKVTIPQEEAEKPDDA